MDEKWKVDTSHGEGWAQLKHPCSVAGGELTCTADLRWMENHIGSGAFELHVSDVSAMEGISGARFCPFCGDAIPIRMLFDAIIASYPKAMKEVTARKVKRIEKSRDRMLQPHTGDEHK